ncbi:DUF4082 domain-containing protein [Nonomuraea sp. NPDC049141]|uniref:DUF4082 domain-containing protein n=1 Tax=Nonomuraea sp. NPDC049141 TaxID=3155500 RepID=UPI0033E24F12
MRKSQPHKGAPEHPHKTVHHVRRRLALPLAAILAMGVIVATPRAAAADEPPVSIGDAAPFGTLASSAVTNTNSTAITGDLGVSPGTTVIGFPPGTVSGSTHVNDATAIAAKADLVDAYDDISDRTPDATVASALGGTTKTPGVYNSTNGTFGISGTLTLDAESDPDAIFIFKAASLTTSNVSNINLVGGAQADNVFWQLSGSATLGTYCTFRGNILASGGVTVSTGAAVFGRLFSVNNGVTLQGTEGIPATRITVPDDPPTTTALTSSLNPSPVGTSVTFTATVDGDVGSLVPEGDVVFKDGSTILGTDHHGEDGPATLTVSNFGAGQHHMTAVFLGGVTFDGEDPIYFAPSKSPVLVQNVTASLWSASATPAGQSTDDRAVTLGVKFKSSSNGLVHGIRFYKGTGNTGTHTGSIWTTGGTLLASGSFSGETATGWQKMTFSTPVAITPNTTYIASYHTPTGLYSYTNQYFTTPFSNDPLTALADGAEGGNGVYTYAATNTFPTSTYNSRNYWVDVLFTPSDSLWGASATPAGQSTDDRAVTLGVKFKSSSNGLVHGIRFYKGTGNTGTHTGSIWTTGGTLLASGSFSGETATGWQKMTFSTPVAITANTTYIASYHTPTGLYSYTRPYFTDKHTRGPLTAFEDGFQGGNGVYAYGATNTFPTSTYNASNYWVDPVFVSP